VSGADIYLNAHTDRFPIEHVGLTCVERFLIAHVGNVQSGKIPDLTFRNDEVGNPFAGKNRKPRFIFKKIQVHPSSDIV
jgi:hypothetical protein